METAPQIFQLSPMQRGMLFHSLYSQEQASYITQIRLFLDGTLDSIALQRAWTMVLDRHPVLRTSFLWEGLEQPLQVVEDSTSLPYEQLDWRALASVEQDRLLDAFLDSDYRNVFEFAKAPLMRVTLIRMAENRHCLIWTHHHILLDGWSALHVFSEVLCVFTALSHAEEPKLSEVPPYRNYIDWLQQQDMSAAEAFWRKELQGISSPTALPADIEQKSARIQELSEEIWIKQELVDQLQVLARKNRLTLNTVIQGAWALLLHRHSGDRDVVFGATVSGRPPEIAGVEQMVGLFINTLPVRVRIHPDKNILEILAQIQASQSDCREYQYAALPDIQGWTAVPRGTALFDSVLVFDNYPVDQSTLKNFGSLRIVGSNSRVRMDIPVTLMIVSVAGKGTGLRIAYQSPMFQRETIVRMLERLLLILEQIASNLLRHPDSLEVLTGSERNLVLQEWNATETPYPRESCLHWYFEEIAAREPKLPALEFEDRKLSYGELNQRANQLAHHLRHAGVQPDEPVAICMDRCLEMVISLLGVLKAGGAYLPVDPSYPEERLAFMMRESKVRFALCTTNSAAKLPSIDLQAVCLDSDVSIADRYSIENPVHNTLPSHLAYVIYTSGSTGTPKGAMLSHSAICNRLLWMQEAYDLTSFDAVLQKTPFTFDVSVWEFFWPLMVGARLVIALPEKHRDSSYLAAVIQSRKITTVHFVPSMLQLMLREDKLHECRSLKRVICSGEALSLELQEHFFNSVPGVELHNLYGPTEAAVDVTYWQCTGQLPLRTVPIGRPIANTQIYILDANLCLVPPGATGELHIGGINLARGYLMRPDLTAEKFIPNGFSSDPGERLYRTGDLARWLPEGILEFLGRADTQVKIRGFRIELGEIEARLRTHPSVMEGVVVAREDTKGEKRLVAYVVPHARQIVIAGELRAFLQQHLPEYMLPAALVVLASMPLNSSGKIDRRALPKPSTERPELIEAFLPPVTQEEKILAEIWGSVLDLEKVGVEDNFFNLGGDSMRSVQVLGLAREQGLNFSLDELFKHPTIRKLSTVLKPYAGTADGRAKIPPFSMIPEEDYKRLPPGLDDAYPLAVLQAGMLFHGEFSPESAIYINITTLKLQAHFDREAMTTAIQHIIRRHAALRTSFSLSGGSQPLQLIHHDAPVPLEVSDIRGLPAEEQAQKVDAWFAGEKSRKFDYAKPPLLRFQIHQLSDVEFQFSWTEHHSILDGWSISIMLAELFQQYFYLIGQEQEPVDSTPLDGMRDFVKLELNALSSKESLAFWKRRLSGSLSTELPRSARSQLAGNEVHRTKLFGVPVPDEIFAGLQRLAHALGTPLKTVLLAAHLRVMSFASGQSDVTTGVSFSGRPENSETDRTLGVFLNILPFRVQLSGGSWINLVRRIFEEEIESLPHRWYPLAKLQTAAGGTPLYDTVFNYTHFRVYRDMLESSSMRMLSSQFYIETNFTFTVHFSLNMFSNRLRIFLDYDTSKLEQQQVQNIADYYLRALKLMVQEPSADFAHQTLLSEDEYARIVAEPNRTEAAYDCTDAVHRLVEKQAETLPNQVAIAFEKQTLTYRKLNQRANRIAHRLLMAELGPEPRVAILMESSPSMIAAMLGTWKVGGAYVPLDPSYPAERIRFIMEDANVAALVTEKPLLAKVSKILCPVLVLDSETFEGFSSQNLDVRVDSASLAYVIYTSGSTGRPKGVAVEHRSLLNLIWWHQQEFLLSKDDKATQIAGVAFDATVWELWPYLTCGASIYIPTQEERMDPARLQAWLKRKQISVSFLPTPLAEQVLQFNWDTRTKLRALLTGGDRLHSAPPAGLPFPVVNNYGPTENTVVATSGQLSTKSGLPPIGRPIANNRAYVLDSWMEPVPLGTPGELFLGGNSLARSYLNQPRLTAEKFVPDPFAQRPGARLYRTGDIVRWNENGELEFQGRSDEQVKVRGFRIELGEIENVLNDHPSVSQAIAMAHEDSSGGKQLVAYVVQKDTRGLRDSSKDQEAQAEQISFWEKIFNDAYSESRKGSDPTFNIVGWNSSYTGQPLPAEEMREWRDATVNRIQMLRAAEIFEIGCGTGLLLFRLAPAATRYFATDFSQVALDYVARTLKGPEYHSSGVQLSCREADDFRDVGVDSFDCVIINSVVQYFPTIDYLTHVLEGAIQATRPGGAIFLGDLRSLPLLETFHSSVALHQAPDSWSKAQLRQRIQQQAMKEEELAVDPLFFHALSQKWSKISHVTVLPKSGGADNELTRFRYDVILRMGAEDVPLTDVPWLDWQTQQLNLVRVQQLLEQGQPEILALANVPNARLAAGVELMHALAEQDNGETVRELKQQTTRPFDDRIAVQSILDLEREAPYVVDVSWSRAGQSGNFDVLLRKKGGAWDFRPEKAISFPREALRFRAWTDYGNNPLQKKFLRQLVPVLKSYLEQKVPEYMVPSAFVVLERLPLTLNGKIDKKALLLPDSGVDSKSRTFMAPRNPEEEMLAAIWAEVLGVEQVGINDNFFELGGDSILSIQVVARANKTGLKLTARHIFQFPTIAQLGLASLPVFPFPEHEQGVITGPLPLTPVQRWFLGQNQPNPHYFNQAILLNVCTPLSPSVLEQAFQKLVLHHDALRIRFSRNDSGWRQINAGLEAAAQFKTVDLTSVSGQHLVEAIENEARKTQAGLNFVTGPVVSVRYFMTPKDEPARLLIVIHHLVIDGVSWRILLEDLQTVCQQIRAQEEVELPLKTTSFQKWARELSRRAQSQVVRDEFEYWASVLSEKRDITVDFPNGKNTVASEKMISGTLSQEETEVLLRKAPEMYQTQINEVLLATLLYTFKVHGMDSLLVDIEGHGREEILEGIDLSRTVGWFTSIFPVYLHAGKTSSMVETLGIAKQELRRIPGKGIGYGLLTYLTEDGAGRELARRIRPEVNFNYLGQFDQTLDSVGFFRPALESVGPVTSSEGLRPYVLAVNGLVIDSHLKVTWTYSENLHCQKTIENLSMTYMATLREILAQSLSQNKVLYTAADFPDLDLSQGEVESMLAELDLSHSEEER